MSEYIESHDPKYLRNTVRAAIDGVRNSDASEVEVKFPDGLIYKVRLGENPTVDPDLDGVHIPIRKITGS